MKIFKNILLFALYLLFSCSVVEDKICDVAIKELEKDYNEWIMEIENSTTLSDSEKEEQINELNAEKSIEIKELKEDCSYLL